jgi:glycerol-1-phosphate dehydrogenase [NAD(P)+]
LTEITFGKIDGVGDSLGRFGVMSQEIPWDLTRDRIGGTPPQFVTMVTGLEEEYLESLIADLPQVETVLGIGGGVSVDAAKYFAWRRHCSAIFVPTILSVNAYATPGAGVRRNGIVNYLGNTIPDRIIIDYRSIQSAPKRLNTAGVGDIYSCRTALFDWKLSHEKTGESYDEEIAAWSRRIIDKLVSNAGDIKNVTEKGIKALVDLHMETNRVQQAAGKPRPEEGSEHIYFYALEDQTKRSYVHGEVVGTGIYVLTAFQSSEEEKVAAEMEDMGLMYRPSDHGTSSEEFLSAVLGMKTYSERAKLPFTVVNVVEITRGKAEELWKRLSE